MQHPGPHLIPVEPEAAEAAEHSRLQEGNPASMQLHDDCKGAVGGQNDVVDHRGVVADPHIVGPVDWAGAMVPHDAGPGRHKHSALKLHQGPLP